MSVRFVDMCMTRKGDETQGVLPGVQFNELPDSWTCPECGAGKDEFEPLS